MRRSRQMVFVSGAPGAGKTSVAVPLAAELGFALVCKDRTCHPIHVMASVPRTWARNMTSLSVSGK
jgi:broad-specificity NMP kinase